MGESNFGREDSRGDWSPDKPISYGPLFAWPPKPKRFRPGSLAFLDTYSPGM